ncbi:hypothetical protein DFJ74DRAFT_665452 [Hyaloraphidium curvatum]|nr:hypothetical protein DFJ74DRAFT_665452 [Hyaloraphidium curvatum]
MPSGEFAAADFAALAARINGRVVQPGDADYDELRLSVWNKVLDAKPTAIVLPETTSDVQAAIKFVAQNKLEFTVAGGRHTLRCFKTGAVAIDLRRMCGVAVDGEKGVAHVGGGAKLFHLDSECAAHGNKFAVAGTNKTTGVGGYMIGGGWGFMARKHGMAVDNIVGADVVTADGKLHTVSAENEPDLLWAIQGAGANFGVVTKLVVKIHPVNACVGGLVIRPFSPESASHVIKSYVSRFHGPGAKPDDEDASSFVLTYGPPGPDGKQPRVAMMLCSWVGEGTAEQAKKALADLTEDKEQNVVANTVGEMPYAEGLQQMMAPVQPPGLWIEKAMFVEGALKPEFQQILIDTFADSPTEGCAIVCHPLGAKIASLPPDATAFPHRVANGNWVVMIGRTDDPAVFPKLEAWMRKWYEKWKPYKTGAFVNEIGSFWTEDTEKGALKDVAATKADYWGSNLGRLAELKAKYDPNNLFRNHNKSLATTN